MLPSGENRIALRPSVPAACQIAPRGAPYESICRFGRSIARVIGWAEYFGCIRGFSTFYRPQIPRNLSCRHVYASNDPYGYSIVRKIWRSCFCRAELRNKSKGCPTVCASGAECGHPSDRRCRVSGGILSCHAEFPREIEGLGWPAV